MYERRIVRLSLIRGQLPGQPAFGICNVFEKVHCAHNIESPVPESQPVSVTAAVINNTRQVVPNRHLQGSFGNVPARSSDSRAAGQARL